MIFTEKNDLEQEDNSSSLSYENEFKELDNEIEKVVRGDTSYEDEKSLNKDAELSNSSNTSQNSNKNNTNNLKDNKNKINNQDLNPNDSNKNNNLNAQCCDESFKSFKNNDNLLNISKKSVVPPMMNSNNNYNNSNNLIKNNLENNTQIPEIYRINKSNQNLSPINLKLNNNIQNYFIISGINNNVNLQDYISMNYNNPNGINNNYQNNNNCQLLNNNINNNSLFSNMNYYFYISQLKEKALSNNILNNLIINNQISNPFNMNLQINNAIINSKINSNEGCKLNNLLNNFCLNNFNDNINNNLRQNIPINNNIQNGMFTFNNSNINNQININNMNNEIMPKLLENQLNNINNNIKKQMNKKNNTKNNLNNSNKKKVFNPLPDSEKEKNIINLMDIFQCKDLRTTLMIKNIPNKYTLTSFLNEININFKNTYDIFYLPIDYINKCNLGFAFINFVEPFHIILFYEIYFGKKWKKFNSDKVCDLLYAKFQGRKELITHFEKGKVLTFENENKRPLILPVPHPLPKINLPFYYYDLFLKLYPYMSYKITINNNKSEKSSLKVFSINGNFHNN